VSLYVVTLAEMKANLGISDAQDDTVLTRWLEGLQDRIEQALGRELLRQVGAEEILDGGERFVYVKRWPVESGTTPRVWLSTDQDWCDDNELDFDLQEFLVKWDRGKFSYGVGNYNWPGGFQNVRIVYTGGFVAAGESAGAGQSVMPEGIRRGTFIQGEFEWRNREHLGQRSINAQGASVNLAPAQLLPEVVRIIEAFKRHL